MIRAYPGWLVALCALVVAVSAWLPWLRSSAAGGGRANGIGGVAGTMPVPPPGWWLPVRWRLAEYPREWLPLVR